MDRARIANTHPMRANFIEWLPLEEGKSVVVPNTVKEPVLDMLKTKKVQLQVMSPAHIEKLALNPGTGALDYILLLGIEVDASIVKGLIRKLKPEGRLVLQVHNRYGMSYLAGKPENYGDYYVGVEGLQEGKSAFYSLKGLETLLAKAGVEQYNRYYLDPDSDYTVHMFSDRYLPQKGDIVNRLTNVTYDRLQMFNEANAFAQSIQDEMYPVFANDYLIVTGAPLPQVMVRYSNDRANAYQVKTEILSLEEGFKVCKTALCKEGEKHLAQIAESYEDLLAQYEGVFAIVPCTYEEGKLTFPFVKGESLSAKMEAALRKNDLETIFDLFHAFLRKLRAGKTMDFANYDFVFGNILIDEDDWNVIDYEWTENKSVRPEELAFRAAYCFYLEHNDFPFEDVCDILGLTSKDVERLIQKECDYQDKVTGGTDSLSVICTKEGGDVYTREALLRALELSTCDNRMQVYEDSGSGFTEARSYFVDHALTNHSEATLTLKVSVGMKALRIDPCEEPCIVQIKKIWWNGQEVYIDNKIIANGTKGKGSKNSYAELIFATGDPNFTISLAQLQNIDGTQNELKIQFELHKISLQLANALQRSVKRII